jgi:K+-transporting ATPase ATPase A chain
VAIAGRPRVCAPLGQTLGSFWVDFTRCTVYVLLPLSVVGALLLVSQGAIQNFHPYTKATTVEGAVQTIPQGPLASQEAIKMIGTNGGGLYQRQFSPSLREPHALR